MAHPFVSYVSERLPEVHNLIREMVECESPSESVNDVTRFVELLAERTRDIAEADLIASEGFGPHLRLRFKTEVRDRSAKQILGLGHSDTVWPRGTLRSMPFRNAEGRLWGPGVLDMKGGLAFFIYGVRALIQLGVMVPRPITLLVVSDEEVGSSSSRPLTEKEALRSEHVLVLEPGTGLGGRLKTARKGIGNYEVVIEGRAAHAGVDFESGASALVEAGRQIGAIAALTDLKEGTTVNPGVIRAGTRSNVVAANARIEVDVRVMSLEKATEVDAKLRGLKVFDQRCRIQVSGGLNRPPMVRTKEIAELFERARSIGAGMGFALEESATGGGSDGNFTAALGIPTLDGVGAVGEGAHAENESILVDRIADRIALLAGLLSGL